ncbi:MAG: hypothetical protein V3S33_03250 [Gammaproteobacteria bacterium]
MNAAINKAAGDHWQAGFSYVEVLIATVLIAVCLVPALDALQAGLKSSEVQAGYIEDHFYLTGKMESVLAEPFSNLFAATTPEGTAVAPSSYSDTVTTPQGRTVTRQVFLRPYGGDNADADNDPFTGTDPGLLWVQVQIAGTPYVVESLTTQ